MSAAAFVSGRLGGRTVDSAIILLVAGAITGYVTRLAIKAEAALAEAERLRAATTERERLASEIHDGVLQVLALVDAVIRLVALDPSIRVLMFSSSGEAVRRTAAAEAVFSPGLAALVLGEHRRIARVEADPAAELTEREVEVPWAYRTGVIGNVMSMKLKATTL